jgi:hypothetical protein
MLRKFRGIARGQYFSTENRLRRTQLHEVRWTAFSGGQRTQGDEKRENLQETAEQALAS